MGLVQVFLNGEQPWRAQFSLSLQRATPSACLANELAFRRERKYKREQEENKRKKEGERPRTD